MTLHPASLASASPCSATQQGFSMQPGPAEAQNDNSVRNRRPAS
jgi:hypothetical protein